MLCSNCFKNEGLRIEAKKIGINNKSLCDRCNTKDGHNIDKQKIQHLIIEFFHHGSTDKDYQIPIYRLSMLKEGDKIPFRSEILSDIKLLNEESGYNIAYNDPQTFLLGITDISERLEEVDNESKQRKNKILDELFDKFTPKVLMKGSKIYRVRKNPDKPIDESEYDSPPHEHITEGRLNDNNMAIFYGSDNISTCVHEVKGTVYDDLFVATCNVRKELNIFSFLDSKNHLDIDDINNHISYISYLFRTDLNYKMCQLLASRAKEKGYDGIEYYSYFSKAAGVRMSNIALFGYPLKNGVLHLDSINKLRIKKTEYEFNFGPVE